MKTTIVAELGANHNSNLYEAFTLIEAAQQAGADYVKFQKRTVDKIFTRTFLHSHYTTPFGSTYGEHRRRLEFTQEQFCRLKAHCEKVGIKMIVTPFDIESADFAANDLKPDFIKIASCDVTNLPLLRFLRQQTSLPLMLSTGMSDMAEVETAVSVLQAPVENLEHRYNDGSPKGLTLMHCVSEYGDTPIEPRMYMIPVLRERFSVPVGYSCHSTSVAPCLAAAMLRCPIIEKHFTLSRLHAGGDHKHSLEPTELARLVLQVREIDSWAEEGSKYISELEKKERRKLAKSQVAARDLPKGHVIAPEDIDMKGPGDGLPGTINITGLTLMKNLLHEEPFQMEHLS